LGKLRGAPSGESGIAFFIIGLADHDQGHFIFSSQVGNLPGIHHARDVLDHFEWAGYGRSRIAERKADALFAMVNCENSHNSAPAAVPGSEDAAESITINLESFLNVTISLCEF